MLVRRREIDRNTRSSVSEQHPKMDIGLKLRRVYSTVTKRFPEVDYLWDDYIRACHVEPIAGLDQIRIIMQQMCYFHGDQPDRWMEWIRWERAHNLVPHNTNYVQSLLLLAMQRHPGYVPMCVELLNINLTRSYVSESFMDAVFVAYETCCRTNATLSCQLAMLDEALRHVFAGQLQTRIMTDMRLQHCEEPLLWHTIARRTLQDHETQSSLFWTGEPTTVGSRIERCVKVYDKAVQLLDTTEMWSLYLDTMLELMDDSSAGSLRVRHQLLDTAYGKARAKGRMTVAYYSKYVDRQYDSKYARKVRAAIMRSDINQICGSVDMWAWYMKHFMRNDDLAGLHLLFVKSCKQPSKHVTQSVWMLYVQYFLETRTADAAKRLNAVFAKVVRTKNTLFDALKVAYLEWEYAVGGLERMRHVFRMMHQLGTSTMELVRKMDGMEASAVRPDVAEWRQQLELAIDRFGATEPAVWLMLCGLEVLHGETSNASWWIDRARNELNVDRVAGFEAALVRLKLAK